MKILLLGEYSNVHATLACGLRACGHQVTVVSNGDYWKNYPRDIDISRHSKRLCDTLRYLLRLYRLLPQLKGYDVVQIINPEFLELKAERISFFYKTLRKQNKSMFMGAFGMDYYWAKAGMDAHTFKYSDFNIGNQIRNNPDNDAFLRDWLYGSKGRLTQYVAQDCTGIVCGLYEYYISYLTYFSPHEKLAYIPFPVIPPSDVYATPVSSPIQFFIGIQKTRNAYKGTDILLRVLKRLKDHYPDKMEIRVAENVPFEQYNTMLQGSDILLDQLYGYTPAMNGLLAMSKGLVLVGGGEEEHYQLLGEEVLRPIVNVIPDEGQIYQALEQLLQNPSDIYKRKQEGLAYIEKHHHYIKIAKKYLRFWQERMEEEKLQRKNK